MIEVRFQGSLGGFILDAAFQVPSRGVTGLFGPSGSGKTSVLRAIAGLQRLEGYCAVGGDIWQDGKHFRPTHKRPVGYVFQEASLFPHLSVKDNLLYGFTRSAVGFEETVDLLGLSRLLERAPANLSGGERQRVAIGRALLSDPKLLLMDEPLSALDRQTKDEILPFLERLHASLALPVLYVSHDIAEVERLADHLVLMRAGRVIASGPLGALQSDPSLPLALSRDAAVSLDAVVEAYDVTYGLASLRVDGGVFLAPSPLVAIGSARRLRIFAGDVSLVRERPSQTTIVNILPVRILSATETGLHEITAVLGLGDGSGARLLTRVTRRSWDVLELAEGLDLYAQIKGAALVPHAGDL
jgi:molybdate transport system ATP-binding protein